MSKSKSKFKHYSLDTILGSVGIAPLILDLGDRYEWVDSRSGHLSPGEKPLCPRNGTQCGPHSRSVRFK